MRKCRVSALVQLALILTICLLTVGQGALAQTTTTLEKVKARGHLECGVSQGVAGFSSPDSAGNWSGIDVDFCRALAAAIFNDPTKVRMSPLSATDRFTALQSGLIDVLARNTTWTLQRDTALGFNFAAITYFDGQGFMVKKSLNVKSVSELTDASICITAGTTHEQNVADYFRAHKMKFEPVVFGTADETVKAYDGGRCDVLTADASGLSAYRVKLQNPVDQVILPEIISKEPLGPAVRQGDDQWLDIVKWTHFAMLTAEELDVTRANVDEMMRSDRPDVRRLLGIDNTLGQSLGLTADWVARIIRHVGNYGEVFDRNLGPSTPLRIARGLNAQWTKGGLQYAPPIR